MIFDILTIFPSFFEGPFSTGIINQAQKKRKVRINVHDLRSFTQDRHKTVDDRPFGGGAGMVLKPEPVFRAVEVIQKSSQEQFGPIILLSPHGYRFDQSTAFRLSHLRQATLICGRYEGVDERVAQFLADEEICIGDYILSGGELAACVVVDAVTRLVPGVLNNTDSVLKESFILGDVAGESGKSYTILDHPHYTRPEDFEGLRVPKILLSGDHKRVILWRRQKAIEKTLKNRPDLIKYCHLSEQDRKLLERDLDSLS